eukprot:g16215.t1
MLMFPTAGLLTLRTPDLPRSGVTFNATEDGTLQALSPENLHCSKAFTVSNGFTPRCPDATHPRNQGLLVLTLRGLWKHFESFILERNMHFVVANIVRPLTQSKGVSFVTLWGGRQVDYFVSHSWGTSFSHFVQSIRCHALSKEGSASWIDAAYWICSFANNQWNIAAELADDPMDSAFARALRGGIKGVAMVLDQEVQPLTRASTALRVSTQVDVTEFALLLCAFAELRVERATAPRHEVSRLANLSDARQLQEDCEVISFTDLCEHQLSSGDCFQIQPGTKSPANCQLRGPAFPPSDDTARSREARDRGDDLRDARGATHHRADQDDITPP